MKVKLLVLLSVLAGCQPATKLTIQPVTADFKASIPGYFYSLPRTVIKIGLTARRDIIIPGPYAEFAAQFLGIDLVPMERKVEWSIMNGSLDAYSESDPEKLFFAESSNRQPGIPDLLNLTKEGLILTPVSIFPAASFNSPWEMRSLDDSIWFTDLSVKDYFAEITDTLYKTVLNDSVFVRVPVLKKEIEQKSPELKAREAAKMIMKIRKRRFDLLSGQYNFITEGAALEVTVRELKKLEEEYLSLFIGKHFSDQHSFFWYHIPGAQGDRRKLCNFSVSDGILSSEKKDGLPLTISVIPENPGTSEDNNPGIIENTFYFRMPVSGLVQISWGANVIAEKRMLIYQFGNIQFMSVMPGKGRK